jgi:hypothetical protein
MVASAFTGHVDKESYPGALCLAPSSGRLLKNAITWGSFDDRARSLFDARFFPLPTGGIVRNVRAVQ